MRTKSAAPPSWTLTFHLSCSKGHRWDDVHALPVDGGSLRLKLTTRCPECRRVAKTIGRRVDAARGAAEAAREVQDYRSERTVVLYARVRNGMLELEE